MLPNYALQKYFYDGYFKKEAEKHRATQPKGQIQFLAWLRDISGIYGIQPNLDHQTIYVMGTGRSFHGR
jgi:hypothetical protein